MFKLFKKKTPIEVLEERYSKLLQESHVLSKTNRLESDHKRAEAEQVMQEIIDLE